MEVKVLAFDIFGTLFDIDSLVDEVSRYVDDAVGFVRVWRSKQLEYSMMLTVMGRYENFYRVTERALRYALSRFNVSLGAGEFRSVLESWLRLRPFDEVPRALPRLASRFTVVALTNGDREMVERLLMNAGLRIYFTEILSADRVGTFKPSPRVYLMVRDLGVDPRDSMFVSSNPWDIAGAGYAGLRTCYVNRYGLPLEELDVTPDITVGSLEDLASALGA